MAKDVSTYFNGILESFSRIYDLTSPGRYEATDPETTEEVWNIARAALEHLRDTDPVAYVVLFRYEDIHGDCWEQDAVYTSRERAEEAVEYWLTDGKGCADEAIALPLGVTGPALA